MSDDWNRSEEPERVEEHPAPADEEKDVVEASEEHMEVTEEPIEESVDRSAEEHREKVEEETVQHGEDGTYSYSSRRAVEHPEEYRKPPYMRDEVAKGNPSGGEPQVRPRLKEFKGLAAGGTKVSSNDQADRDNAGRQPYSSEPNGRPSHNNENGRQPYDNGYSDDRQSYGSGDSRKPKHKYLLIAILVILIGTLVGASAWSAGQLITAAGGTSALEEVQKDMKDGKIPAYKPSEDESTGESAAESAGSDEPVIKKNPSGEVSADSPLITGLPDVVDLAMPSVVAITVKTVYENYSQFGSNPFFGGYGNGGSSTYEVEGAGSGIIIGDDGTELWIVTNNHVVEDTKEVTVGFCDDEHVAAYIKGTDPSNDLAVVGVKIADLKESTKDQIRAIQMGDSDSLRLGETVIAIGNALGIGQSVTTGIVSALNREITTEANNTLNTIQTDAAINPGNSGGALLNSAGELIGINVAKGSDDNVEGMGYAIPISNAREIIDRLTTMEPRVPVSQEDFPYLGVQLKNMDKSYASTYGIPEGVLVYSISEDSPAAKGGMITHDIIVKFEGVEVTSYDSLINEMQYYAAGTTVTVTVSRLEDGAYTEKDLTITLGRKSDYTQEETQESKAP